MIHFLQKTFNEEPPGAFQNISLKFFLSSEKHENYCCNAERSIRQRYRHDQTTVRLRMSPYLLGGEQNKNGFGIVFCSMCDRDLYILVEMYSKCFSASNSRCSNHICLTKTAISSHPSHESTILERLRSDQNREEHCRHGQHHTERLETTKRSIV